MGLYEFFFPAQVMRELEDLDPVDGAADGQLDVRLLRKYLGTRRDDD